MAISTKGVIAYKLYEKGGSNKDRFLDFLQENILSKMNNKLIKKYNKTTLLSRYIDVE